MCWLVCVSFLSVFFFLGYYILDGICMQGTLVLKKTKLSKKNSSLYFCLLLILNLMYSSTNLLKLLRLFDIILREISHIQNIYFLWEDKGLAVVGFQFVFRGLDALYSYLLFYEVFLNFWRPPKSYGNADYHRQRTVNPWVWCLGYSF